MSISPELTKEIRESYAKATKNGYASTNEVLQAGQILGLKVRIEELERDLAETCAKNHELRCNLAKGDRGALIEEVAELKTKLNEREIARAEQSQELARVLQELQAAREHVRQWQDTHRKYVKHVNNEKPKALTIDAMEKLCHQLVSQSVVENVQRAKNTAAGQKAWDDYVAAGGSLEAILEGRKQVEAGNFQTMEEFMATLTAPDQPNSVTVGACQCGGDKAKVPHSHWCPAKA